MEPSATTMLPVDRCMVWSAGAVRGVSVYREMVQIFRCLCGSGHQSPSEKHDQHGGEKTNPAHNRKYRRLAQRPANLGALLRGRRVVQGVRWARPGRPSFQE